jgi:hypothetical protein
MAQCVLTRRCCMLHGACRVTHAHEWRTVWKATGASPSAAMACLCTTRATPPASSSAFAGSSSSTTAAVTPPSPSSSLPGVPPASPSTSRRSLRRSAYTSSRRKYSCQSELEPGQLRSPRESSVRAASMSLRLVTYAARWEASRIAALGGLRWEIAHAAVS